MLAEDYLTSQEPPPQFQFSPRILATPTPAGHVTRRDVCVWGGGSVGDESCERRFDRFVVTIHANNGGRLTLVCSGGGGRFVQPPKEFSKMAAELLGGSR